MHFRSEVNSIPLEKRIDYHSKVLSIGSCFTEHIAGRLSQSKFQQLSNVYGEVYNPVSIAMQLEFLLRKKVFEKNEVFMHEGVYKSYYVHSKMGAYTENAFISKVNEATEAGHVFLQSATHVFITLGTAYVHRLNSSKMIVANNHKQPAHLFTRDLLSVSETVNAMDAVLQLLLQMNPEIEIVFTISPVRHIREGLIENTRSKSILFVALHQLIEKYKCQYFPAYEYVIDDLRDYRFYAPDLVHPNQQAIDYVWDKFKQYAIDASCYTLMNEVQSIVSAMQHRPFFPEASPHREFRKKMLQTAVLLQKENPEIDLSEEIKFFS